jgi:murein DD-endopeptidase MepM/ murein hydrolase activator NlpD
MALEPTQHAEGTSNGSQRPERPRRLAQLWAQIRQRGWQEDAMRYAGHAGLVLIVILGVVAARRGLDTLLVQAAGQVESAPAVEEATPEAAVNLSISDLLPYAGGPLVIEGIAREADVHTEMPDRPRLQIVKYVVQKGDTLFGIAEKFGLKPESILWGNWTSLEGDPHSLTPGQELSVLPVDGALHVWSPGESLSKIAEFYKVMPEEIIDWPSNRLELDEDLEAPDIAEGTALVIPGGKRDAPTWRTPRITRANPASARILGPGACGSVSDGPIGTGGFAWPTSSTWISGYHYDGSVHPAIDLGGSVGNAIYASDTGVVVYSGWNDWGYGYVVVIDHGNGWQTLYAHLSSINVGCGQAVFQGGVIGGMGCTGNCSGPHLHFEMMSDDYGKVNPLDFLP